MSSVFAETVVEYINDYRTVLRKSLPQAERMLRLKRLNLKSITVYSDDVELFNTSNQILEDIDVNGKIPDQGYYSYSGLQNFYYKQNSNHLVLMVIIEIFSLSKYDASDTHSKLCFSKFNYYSQSNF